MESHTEERMTTTTQPQTAQPQKPADAETRRLARILDEGYGPGAWHGSDLKAAAADVSPELAFWRAAAGRHNIAEIALHHAFCARAVRAKLSGAAPEPFLLEGEDWFEASGKGGPSWPEVRAALDQEQQRLARVLADIGAGRLRSPLPEGERFDLVLGITCHAIYHAGQMQLLKRLHS
jgi:DinB family protein